MLDAKPSTRAQSVSGGGAEIRDAMGDSDPPLRRRCSLWRMTPNSAYAGGSSLSVLREEEEDATEDEEDFFESLLDPS